MINVKNKACVMNKHEIQAVNCLWNESSGDMLCYKCHNSNFIIFSHSV